MPESNDNRRRAEILYESYSTNLEWYKPELKDLFVCPLCFRIFDRDALVDGTLTIEHIIPSSIGGRLTTLTCRDCNNQAGSELEANLVQEARVDDIFRARLSTSIRSVVAVGEGEQAADVSFFDEGELAVVINGLPQHTNPVQQELVEAALSNGARSFKITSNFGYRHLPAQVAKIRSAYLMMFRYFGYAYIRDSRFDDLRKLFVTPDENSPYIAGLFELPDPIMTNVVGLVKSPEEIRGFLVILDMSTESERHVGMLFPGFDAEAGELYQRLKSRQGQGLRAEQIDAPYYDFTTGFLIDPYYKEYPYRIWIGAA